MHDELRQTKLWLKFGGFVLVVAVLYFAQVIIVPVALALLITFVLSPIVTPIQRRLGGVVAVLLVVAVTFAALGAAGWAVTTQLRGFVTELPTYQQNVRQKIRDVRWLGQGGSVETLQDTVHSIESEMASGEPRGTTAKPVVVESAPTASLWGLPTILGPWLEPLTTAALVMALVVFMLLERQDLRNRLISLLGHGHVTVTTRAFYEAGSRVSSYLLAQSLVNLCFGVCAGVGLFVIGVPYFVLWAALAAVLRFIPYFGPLIAALAPLLVSLVAFDGWTGPLLVLALYGGLELVTNLIVESFFFAGAAGVSQVGLLVAVAFWTWLWGPLGLLMATPLTVCLVVIGKYVPGFEFIATLLADTEVLRSDVTYYQRLLAGDEAEASELIEQHADDGSAESVFDAMLIPALNYAERDRLDGRLSIDEEKAIIEISRQLLEEAAELLSAQATPPVGAQPDGSDRERVLVLGWPAHGDADSLALEMLATLLKDTPFAVEVLGRPAFLANGLQTLKERGCKIVCIADLPPSNSSKSRQLVKRLRAAMPELTILVGRWAPSLLADDSSALLRDAGADHVAPTLLETREQLSKSVQVADLPTVDQPLMHVAAGGSD